MTASSARAELDAAPAPVVQGHPFHLSLSRPVLFAGAEPRIVVVEATTAFALLFAAGLHIAPVLLAVGYLTVVHGIMVWVAADDWQLPALYLRSLAARDFYLPHADARNARSFRVSPALPTEAA